jgi:hypothetical protein
MDPLGILGEIMGGVLVGLLLGPLIYTLAGCIAYMISGRKIDKVIEEEHRKHAYMIAKQKKRYDKANAKYMKCKLKVEKFIERKKRDKSTEATEPEV